MHNHRKYLLQLAIIFSGIIAFEGINIEEHCNFASNSHLPQISSALAQYFAAKTDILHVRAHFHHHKPTIISEHLTSLVNNSTHLAYRINIQNGRNRVITKFLNYHNLWYVDSYSAMRQILPISKLQFGKFSGKYAIIYFATLNIDHRYEMKKMMEALLELNVIDVIIILLEAGSTNPAQIPVYGSHIFQPQQCRVIQPIIVNTFRKGQFHDKKLFPNKLNNFYNCTLRVIARNAPPYAIYRESPKRKLTTRNVVGIDGALIEALAQKLNFQVEFYTNPEHMWGEVTENGSMSGPYLMLEQKEVDVLLGYFVYSATAVAELSESVSYMPSALVAVIRRLNYKKTSRTWLLDPFERATWFYLLAYVLLTVAFLKLFNSKYARMSLRRGFNNANWLDVLAMAFGIGNSVSRATSRWRCTITFWCLGYIIINGAYQAKIYDAFNRYQPTERLTLRELVARNYTFMSQNTLQLSQNMGDLNLTADRMLRLGVSDSRHIFEIIREKRSARLATFTHDLLIVFYMRNPRLYGEFQILPEIVQLQYSCAYFQHHSYLLTPFNKVIKNLRDFGLIHMWRNYAYFLVKRSEYTISGGWRRRKQSPEQLTLSKFYFIFEIWGALLSVVVMVFLGELIVHRLNQRRKK